MMIKISKIDIRFLAQPRTAHGSVTLPPHSLAQPPSFDAVVSFSLRLAVQWLHDGADTCSPRPSARILSIPPAPSSAASYPSLSRHRNELPSTRVCCVGGVWRLGTSNWVIK
eukprot:scaffold81557_cov51-Phaeocystis_antarctica.AAC.1